MEKIGSSDNTRRRKEFGKTGKRIESSHTGKTSFHSLLDTNSNTAVTPDSVNYGDMLLEDLLDDIHETGDSLKDLPTLQNVRDYKQAVSRFLKYIVENTLETETEAGIKFNPLKKQKRYTIIRTVNEKLEQLAAGVLQNQADKLEILQKLEEINGMLINLLK